MQIIKKKLLKSTVAKVMAAAMVVSVIPMPTTVSVKATEVENGTETPVDESSNLIFPTNDGVTINNNTVTLTEEVTLQNDWILTSDVTLELAGHKMTCNKITVGSHTLIINDNDSTEDTKGTITKKDDSSGVLIDVGEQTTSNEKGTVILNSGTIKNKNDYGILSEYNSSVYINGGKIDCKYAALSSNNTTGDANFYISGGELIADYGPCIYKPSMGNLFIGTEAVKGNTTTISGNVINEDKDKQPILGSISIREGNVRITGGTISAVKNNIDSPAEYYDYSGNVWFPDTLFVLGGTYKSSTGEGTDNGLDITITDGTFNCTNDKGSAIAIYDFGKEEQKINVNIFGGNFTKDANPASPTYAPRTGNSAKNDNSASRRTAFDVLTLNTILDDTTLPDGYDKNGKATIKKSITSGIFYSLSSSIREDISKNNNSCLSNNTDNEKVIVAVHNDNITTEPAIPAAKDKTGHVAYKTCNNCKKVTVNYNGKNEERDSANNTDLNLYYLSITEQSEGIEATLTNSSYGKLQDGELIISPKAGYEIVGDVTFTTNLKNLITIEPKENSSQNTSKTYTITATDNASTLDNCNVTIAAQTKKVDYTLTCNSSLKNADAKLADTALNKDGSTILTITPKAGYGFTATTKPVVTADGATIGDPTVADGVYTYKISAPTKNCTITVSGEATPVTYKVSLDKSGLKDANAYIIKGDNKVTTETVDATVNDKLQVVVEPNAGKVFTELPTVNGSATTLESGAYKYNVPALTGDTTLKVSGTAEDVKYRIKFTNEPTIEHATVKLEPAQAALNGNVINLRITKNS